MSKAERPRPATPTDWGDVADWYDRHVGDGGSDYHQHVVLPGTLRLLEIAPGEEVLDVACGQGVLCRLLHERGARVTGIDAARALLDAARRHGPKEVRYLLGDARALDRLDAGSFASAACVLALQNIHPLQPVFDGVARALRPGGRFVIVVMHPCFRGAKQTSWGWDAGVQYRRVDRYLVPSKTPIVTHPGKRDGAYTWSFHKPLQAYVRALRQSSLLIDALEEWPTHRRASSGPRAAAENRAFEEIPMFLALRAVRVEIGSQKPAP